MRCSTTTAPCGASRSRTRSRKVSYTLDPKTKTAYQGRCGDVADAADAGAAAVVAYTVTQRRRRAPRVVVSSRATRQRSAERLAVAASAARPRPSMQRSDAAASVGGTRTPQEELEPQIIEGVMRHRHPDDHDHPGRPDRQCPGDPRSSPSSGSPTISQVLVMTKHSDPRSGETHLPPAQHPPRRARPVTLHGAGRLHHPGARDQAARITGATCEWATCGERRNVPTCDSDVLRT